MSQLDSRLYTKKAAAEVTERLKKKLKNECWSERGWASGRASGWARERETPGSTWESKEVSWRPSCYHSPAGRALAPGCSTSPPGWRSSSDGPRRPPPGRWCPSCGPCRSPSRTTSCTTSSHSHIGVGSLHHCHIVNRVVILLIGIASEFVNLNPCLLCRL